MIVYFAPTILTDNGFSTTAALNVSVGLGLTYLVMQIIGMAIVDKVGRRRLTLIMVPGAAISLFVLGTLFITGNTDRHTSRSLSAASSCSCSSTPAGCS